MANVSFYSTTGATGSTGNLWGMYSSLTSTALTNTKHGSFSYSSSSTSNYQWLYKVWRVAVSALNNQGYGVIVEPGTYDNEILCLLSICKTNTYPYGESTQDKTYSGVVVSFIDGIGNFIQLSILHSSQTTSTLAATLSSSGTFYVQTKRGMAYE